MKKLLAIALVLGLATAANAALTFVTEDVIPGGAIDVQNDALVRIGVISSDATVSFKLSIKVSDPVAEGDVALGGVAGGFDSLPTAGILRSGTNDLFIQNMGGGTAAGTNPVVAGEIGWFFIDTTGMKNVVITIDDFAGTSPYGGPPLATKLNGVTVDMAALPINVIPEPMTMSLLALGGLGLLRRRG